MNINNFKILKFKYIISSVICCLFLLPYSCNTRNSKTNTSGDSISNTLDKLKTKNSNIIQLNYFDSIPSAFKYDGGDMYTYDTTQLADKKYIFLSNLSGVAAIKMNGHEIYLKLDSSQSTVRKNDSCKEVWVGNSIQIVLRLKVVRDFEENEGEGSYLKGIMELKTKNTLRKIKIHGYTEV